MCCNTAAVIAALRNQRIQNRSDENPDLPQRQSLARRAVAAFSSKRMLRVWRAIMSGRHIKAEG